MKLTILIPAYNEAHSIKEVIRRIKALNLGYDYEILVVDDGSTDQTSEIIKKIDDVHLITHEVNKGKGAALKTGFEAANGDIVIIQDADMEYLPKEIPKLIAPLIEGTADVVYGSRFKGTLYGMTFSHALGNLGLTLATSLLFGTKVTDMMTGYKVFQKYVLKNINIKADRFEVEPDITGRILQNGYRLIELPIEYHKRKKGKAKISKLDGVRSLIWLLKLRLRLH
ncbi:MAG: glycosyltransferase family 2 protein [Promethearchaeota archaeon]